MKNKLSDLNNYLFEQVERINDDSLTGERLQEQLQKAEAITNIAETIIKNQDSQLKALIKLADNGAIENKTCNQILLGVLKDA